jgi:hypothetical protein
MFPKRFINYTLARVPRENDLGVLVTELHILNSSTNLHVKTVSYPCSRPWKPLGFETLRISHFLDDWLTDGSEVML